MCHILAAHGKNKNMRKMSSDRRPHEQRQEIVEKHNANP